MIAIRTFTRSSSFRVGAILSSLSVAAISFIIYFWYISSDEILLREARAAVDAEAFALTEAYRNGGNTQLNDAITRRISRPRNRTLVAASTGGQIFSGNMKSIPSLQSSSGQTIITIPLTDFIQRQYIDTYHQSIDDMLFVYRDFGDVQLAVGRNIDDLIWAQNIGRYVSWVFVLLLIIMAALSLSVALYVVKRINRMSDTASNIMETGNLGDRMEIDSSWDDLSKLAVVFNRMLAKIETSVNDIKRVTDNIAHDLRTPLTRLRGQLERLPDSDLKSKSLNEADNLMAMFNGLLRIADIESERQKAGFATIDWHTIAIDIVELYEPLIESNGIDFKADISPTVIDGDRHLLFQAMSNLMDNAIKYAGPRSHIRLHLKATDKLAVLSVDDSGPGITELDFSQLGRRFFRSELSRTSPGNGLGLSMVQAIIELHNGRLWYIDNPLLKNSGFGVTVTIPLQ